MHRHVQQRRAVADKNARERRGEPLRRGEHHHRARRDQHQTAPQQPVKLAVIARAVVVAYHGGAADGVADEDGGEDHADVHHHAVGGDAVVPGVLDELEVIEHAHKAHGHVAHEFGRAVGAGLQKRPAVIACSAEAQDAGIFAREVHERDAPADDLTERRGDRRPGELMLLRQRHNEHRVQHHVRHTRRDRHDKSEMRLLRRDKKALKEILHHDERQRA